MAAPAKSTPKDAQVMQAILKDMGVMDYEPRVVNQMLEFTYRYVTDVLDDAKSYSAHANKKSIDLDDVKLALQCKLDHAFTTPPPRDLLMDISRHKNNSALPVIKPYTGPKLPPDRYCLSNSNYKLRSLRKTKVQMIPAGSPVGSSLVAQRITGTTLVRPGVSNLGAGALTVVTRGVTTPTFTYRPVAATANQPQVIRVQPGSGSTTPSSVATSLVNSTDSASLKRKRDDDDDYDV